MTAWEKIETVRPNLVILDLMMPGLDGWELCRRIRQDQRKEVREMGVVMLTARAMEEDKIRGLEQGADDYVTKPFSLSELVLRIGKILDKKATLGVLHREVGRLQGQWKMIEENLQRVVHDLKTPLIAMGVMARLLINNDKREEKMKYLKNIYESSVELNQCVEGILEFYSIPSQPSPKEMQPLNPQSLVQKTVDLLSHVANEKQIEMIFHPSPVIPMIPGDAPSLQRAINNLVANAVKYTPAGGKIEITLLPHSAPPYEGTVEFSIRDTGVGIPQEDLQWIFEPFYRGNNVGEEKGIGLGLALVREVIALHGGNILVRSEPGQGSTFSILLPTGRVNQEREVSVACNENVNNL